ncbi:alpha/beta hydrolase [Acidaminobacter sp. JC074]|uniref:alpha/beta hydrolase n=1 Tax=Acidaminobacter sp. JC074 TaxID=2530199 RepID=UPI001F1146F2|nr:alpha/beta hydrolase [Acidaminobacter sp. JC074]MCH4890846.1 alpha/beta hydrolase [Acidaminobacter sp. JC074]
MKRKSNKKKIIIGIFAGLLALVLVFTGYVNIKYSHIDSSLRLKGYLVDKMMNFDDQASMIEYSNKSRASMRPVAVDDDVTVDEQIIKGKDGHDIRVLVFKNKEATGDAVGLLWIHGGGYVIGAPDQDGLMISEFMNAANTVVVAPDYRLSAQAPYPAALNDCYDSLLWMKENADALGINPDQLFIAGQSAGGGLTAATSLYARDMNEVNVAFQIPIYPMINSKMDLPSAIGNEEFLWDSKKNHAAWQLYLDDLYMTEDIPKYASPSEEKDCEGLPPTYTFVGSLDPFYDETIQYINELKADGVEASYDSYEGAYHGFDIVGMIGSESKLARQALDKLMEAYVYASENYTAPQN